MGDSKIETIIDLLNTTPFFQRLALNLIKKKKQEANEASVLTLNILTSC